MIVCCIFITLIFIIASAFSFLGCHEKQGREPPGEVCLPSDCTSVMQRNVDPATLPADIQVRAPCPHDPIVGVRNNQSAFHKSHSEGRTDLLMCMKIIPGSLLELYIVAKHSINFQIALLNHDLSILHFQSCYYLKNCAKQWCCRKQCSEVRPLQRTLSST